MTAEMTMPATAEASAPSRSSWRRLFPWWLQVLAVFVVTRVVTTAIMLRLAVVHQGVPWTGLRDTYVHFATTWDGGWYQTIGMTGYPSVLPLSPTGLVEQNPWAFMPVYPFTVRALMTVTGLDWANAAVLVALLCSAAACLVLYRLFRVSLSEGQSLMAVVFFCVAPTSPILQIGYAESAAILLTATMLLLLVRKRWGWVFPIILVLGLLRPSGLAIAAMMGLYFLFRIWQRVRSGVAFPRSEVILTIALGAWGLFVGFAWLLIAWAVTGSFSAYTDTELAWRSVFIGEHELVPFTSWFAGGGWWGQLWFSSPMVGMGIVVVIVLGFLALFFSASARRLDVFSRTWIGGYAIYLFAFFYPQSSTFRILMPMFPLFGALAVPRSPLFRVFLVAASLMGQVVWLLLCWVFTPGDWSPP
ncbi:MULTISPECIES: hypothetical protein [unclassified Rathayibacter]|uniref:hypothetical protein n=1 Tax=unclassified Rathayibacter TaxID=2609250 RepID=UPI00188AD7A4|nr:MULTISPECIES: hypothetical protein [unclassified Rathayibacter]MBF4463491.1 hypothetical protein [Rathayibacter sp. VKM Ac-2879]MBF4504787.1 hypothetical protein [Rathayibacter sp. VKM Ac-2878]